MDNVWICKPCVKSETGLDAVEQFMIGDMGAACVQCGERRPRADMYHVPEDWRRHVPRWREWAEREKKPPTPKKEDVGGG